MATPILIFLVLIVVFALTFKVSQSLLGASLGRVVSARHHAAEELSETGSVPSAWIRRHEAAQRRARRLRRGKLDDASVARLEERAKTQALKGLADLIEYFRRAPVFDSEETRQQMLATLIEIGNRWEQQNWREMVEAGVSPTDENACEPEDEPDQ